MLLEVLTKESTADSGIPHWCDILVVAPQSCDTLEAVRRAKGTESHSDLPFRMTSSNAYTSPAC